MRILNVFQTYALFGKGNHAAKIQTISKYLVARGHHVEILAVDYARRLRGSTEQAEGVQVDYVGAGLQLRNVSLSPGALPFLVRKVAAFDIVHIYGIYDLLGLYTAAACRAFGVPYVVEPMGMFVPIVNSLRLKGAYHALVGRPMFAGAARLIATSEQEANELRSQGIPNAQIVTRLNGIDLAEFRDLPARGAFRAELGIAADTPLVMYLGRLAKKKALEVLAEAVANLGPDVHLAIVGPDERDGTIARLEAIRLERGLGARLHLAEARYGRARIQALVDADLFVLPSINENFGNVAAEAIACGVPAIVSDGCGIAPYINGRAARVVASNVGAMTAAIRELLAPGPARDALLAGCAGVTREMSWDGRIAEMEKLYGELRRLPT